MFSSIPGPILEWAINGLLYVAVGLGGLWLRRLQADVASCSAACVALKDDLHAYKLQCLREFAIKADTTAMEEKILDQLKSINQKLDGYQTQLNQKADK